MKVMFTHARVVGINSSTPVQRVEEKKANTCSCMTKKKTGRKPHAPTRTPELITCTEELMRLAGFLVSTDYGDGFVLCTAPV